MDKINKISDSLFDIAEPTEQISREKVRELAQRILDRSGHRDATFPEVIEYSGAGALERTTLKG